MDRHSLVENRKEVSRVLWVTFVLNEAVALAKLLVGYMTGSVGMVSDGFHSLTDGVTNIVGLIGIRIASAPPDREHPYGHRKFESLFTAIVGLTIFGTCLEVARNAIASLMGKSHVEIGLMSFMVMAVTMGVNIFVMRYESRRGRQLKSDFLLADSKHTGSDIMTSAGVLVGLLLTKLGVEGADAIAGLVVAVFIARMGLEIIKTSADVLVDTMSVDIDAVCRVAMGIDGVKDCHDIRSRGSRNHISIDMHILLPPDVSLREAHDKAHEVEKAVRKAIPSVRDIVVHTEPDS